MKVTISREGKVFPVILQEGEDWYIQLFDAWGNIFPVHYEDLDYDVDNAGPFQSYDDAMAFGFAIKSFGEAEHEIVEPEVVPANWQQLVEQDTDYEPALGYDDYFGAVAPY